MDNVLAAISDESRRTVLSALSRGPATVTELAALLPIARPGVSRHLRVLREVGLVDVRADAQRRIYSLHPQPLAELDAWLEPYRALWTNRLDALHTEIARGKRHSKPDFKHGAKQDTKKKAKKSTSGKRKKNGRS
jgi:DNA-binding transcriptional ArsR family regulator